jgi:hypothetical protein
MGPCIPFVLKLPSLHFFGVSGIFTTKGLLLGPVCLTGGFDAELCLGFQMWSHLYSEGKQGKFAHFLQCKTWLLC